MLGALGTELMGVNGWICVVGAPEEALPGNVATTALVGALVIPLAAPGEAPASCQGLQVKDPEDHAARGSGDRYHWSSIWGLGEDGRIILCATSLMAGMFIFSSTPSFKVRPESDEK